jgi:hypothetical protein
VTRLRTDGLNKYDLMREVLSQLDGAGERGYRVQVQLVQAMIAAPLSDNDGIDVAAAKAAQSRVRDVAEEHGLLPETQSQRAEAEERAAAARRRNEAKAPEAERERRRKRRAELFREYCELLQAATNRQGRGYWLEEMIGELAELDGLRWAPPFRKGTVTQTDGMTTYEGFRYLIGARWRVEPADVQAIAALAHKASRNFSSTPGLFISVMGFRPEVVRELETGDKNVLLMSGRELSLVLEAVKTLPRALQLKLDEGSKKGHIFYDLASDAIV